MPSSHLSLSLCCYVCWFSWSYVVLRTTGHSWVHCTDYDGELSGNDYNTKLCNGYVRSFLGKVISGAMTPDGAFGHDAGLDHQPGTRLSAGSWCETSISTSADFSDTYSSDWPMASYKVGQSIRVTWPSKNHANYGCPFSGGVLMPDKSLKIYVNAKGGVNPQSDPYTLSDWTLLWDFHKGYDTSLTEAGIDGVGFQNCPGFCESKDKAVCFGDFNLLSNVDELDWKTLFPESGVYTFMWLWGFRTEDDLYSNCWEAYVDASSVVDDCDNDLASLGSSDPSQCVYKNMLESYAYSALDSTADQDPHCMTYDPDLGCVTCDYDGNYFKVWGLETSCMHCDILFSNTECNQCMDQIGCLECASGYTPVYDDNCRFYTCQMDTPAPIIDLSSTHAPLQTEYETSTENNLEQGFVCPKKCATLHTYYASADEPERQVCSCAENEHCSSCHPWGCLECEPGYFFRGYDRACASCKDVFGDGCMDCGNWVGCSTCAAGYTKLYDDSCEISYCA